MAPALDIEALKESVIQAVVTLSSDPIPNIRFNVAKALEVLSTVLANQAGGRELVQQSILPSLHRLKDDTDADVRFFASKALEIAEPVSQGTYTGPPATSVLPGVSPSAAVLASAASPRGADEMDTA